MTLPEYLKRENLTPTAFAERIGMPSSTITRILRGERQPSFGVMQKISESTRGEVSALSDFVIQASPFLPDA